MISTAMKKTELQRHEFSFRPDTIYSRRPELKQHLGIKAMKQVRNLVRLCLLLLFSNILTPIFAAGSSYQDEQWEECGTEFIEYDKDYIPKESELVVKVRSIASGALSASSFYVALGTSFTITYKASKLLFANHLNGWILAGSIIAALPPTVFLSLEADKVIDKHIIKGRKDYNLRFIILDIIILAGQVRMIL